MHFRPRRRRYPAGEARKLRADDFSAQGVALVRGEFLRISFLKMRRLGFDE